MCGRDESRTATPPSSATRHRVSEAENERTPPTFGDGKREEKTPPFPRSTYSPKESPMATRQKTAKKPAKTAGEKPPVRFFKRQRFLLQFLDALGGESPDSAFQQRLFLYRQAHTREDAFYDFVPMDDGPFSLSAQHDQEKLIARGALVDDATRWALTAQGQDEARAKPAPDFTSFVQGDGQLHGKALRLACFERFPYYATRVPDLDTQFADERATLKAVACQRKQPTDAALFSIGYEGRSLEQYLNLLLQNGVTILADVRKHAHSHKFGFSETILSTTVQNLGIRYCHFSDLGIAAYKRRDLKTPEDYQKLFEDYRLHWLPKQSASIDDLLGLFSQGERIALTCFEHQHQACHRHCVSDVLEQRLGHGFTAVRL